VRLLRGDPNESNLDPAIDALGDLGPALDRTANDLIGSGQAAGDEL